MFIPRPLPGSLWQVVCGLHVFACFENNERQRWKEVLQKRAKEALWHFSFISTNHTFSVCFIYLVNCFFSLSLHFLCAPWALVLDYIWFNLLKATCDQTTERDACGNGGRKALEMPAVRLKRCRKENGRESAKERGCWWRKGKLEK